MDTVFLISCGKTRALRAWTHYDDGGLAGGGDGGGLVGFRGGGGLVLRDGGGDLGAGHGLGDAFGDGGNGKTAAWRPPKDWW